MIVRRYSPSNLAAPGVIHHTEESIDKLEDCTKSSDATRVQCEKDKYLQPR